MSGAAQRKSHPMPEMAAFVANLRSAFGASIDEAVARGKAGEPTFYARENGRVVGTSSDEEHNKWSVGTDVMNRRFCRGCDGSCVGTSTRCSLRNTVV